MKPDKKHLKLVPSLCIKYKRMGMTTKEIADKLGMSENSVGNILFISAVDQRSYDLVLHEGAIM